MASPHSSTSGSVASGSGSVASSSVASSASQESSTSGSPPRPSSARGRCRRRGGAVARLRGTRFSPQESRELVTQVIQHYQEILGAHSKRHQTVARNVVWAQITGAINDVGGNGRSVDAVRKHYNDIRRMVRIKLDRARKDRGAGRRRTAGLTDYEDDLLEYLGEEAFRGIQWAVDKDMPAPTSVAVPQTSPEGPGTPELGQLPGPALRKQSASPMSDHHSSPSQPGPSQPGPSRRPTDAAEASGSSTPLLTPDEEQIVTLYPVDPDATDHPAASQAPLPTHIPDLEAVHAEVAGIADDVRAEAILATERARQDQEDLRQHLHYQAETVSLMRERNEVQREIRDLLARLVADNSAHNSLMIDVMQVLAGGLLETPPDRLFPSRRVRRAQGDEGSGDAE